MSAIGPGDHVECIKRVHQNRRRRLRLPSLELDGWLREPAQVVRFHGEVFLHQSRRPLASVDLTPTARAPDMFGQECEGMCGV